MNTVTTNTTYPVTDFIPFLKNQRLKHQNQIQHKRIQDEHPAGARWFSSNGQTTATKIPSRVASCLPDFVYRTVWLIPESRLAD